MTLMLMLMGMGMPVLEWQNHVAQLEMAAGFGTCLG